MFYENVGRGIRIVSSFDVYSIGCLYELKVKVIAIIIGCIRRFYLLGF